MSLHLSQFEVLRRITRAGTTPGRVLAKRRAKARRAKAARKRNRRER